MLKKLIFAIRVAQPKQSNNFLLLKPQEFNRFILELEPDNAMRET